MGASQNCWGLDPRHMSQTKPRLALVTLGIRRDLLAPLRYFSRVELVHFYRDRAYGDLAPEDLDASLRQFTTPTDLYRQLVAARPDFIQGVEPFSYYTQPYMWAGYFAARRTGAALIVGTHENRPLDVKFGKMRAALLQRALHYYFQRARRIIVHNNGARENVLQCGIEAKAIVRGMWGNWGVDTTEFVPARNSGTARNPTILFAGRLHQEKGVFVLMDALQFVRRQMPQVRLIIAGDGPARRALELKVESLDLTENVTFIGMVRHREMPRVFQQADVLCAPSLTTRKWAEQVGSSLLQAMSCGVPVVATRSGAIPEYVPDGEAGLLVQENDARALADALLEILRDPLRARALGEFGRALAITRYDARVNVERGEKMLFDIWSEIKQ